MLLGGSILLLLRREGVKWPAGMAILYRHSLQTLFHAHTVFVAVILVSTLVLSLIT